MRSDTLMVFDPESFELSIRMREIRVRQGLKQADTARRMGLDLSTISLWERGKRLVPRSRVPALAAALEVSVDGCVGRRLVVLDTGTSALFASTCGSTRTSVASTTTNLLGSCQPSTISTVSFAWGWEFSIVTWATRAASVFALDHLL